MYNHMLGSQRPQDCHQSYNTPLNGVKSFRLQDIWGGGGKPPCCISSTMREIARTPEAIWTKFADNGVGVLIYNQGAMEDTVRTPSGPVTVRLEIESDYPRSGEVLLRVRPAKPARFRLALRAPGWAKRSVATVGGQRHACEGGRFLDLHRTWREGDTVRIVMDLNERLVSGGASYPGHFAFMRGPQVLTLCAKRGSEDVLDRAVVQPDGALRLNPVQGFFPDGWSDSQAYQTPALCGVRDCALIPFGEAGQPGLAARFRTWIPAESNTAPAVPPAPGGLTATALSPYKVRLVWSYRGGNERGFRIERKRGDIGVWFHVKTTPAGVTSCEDDAVNVVLPGNTYTYRVCAYNEGGPSAYSNEATVTTPAVAAPAAPEDLKAAAVSPTQINLSWISRGKYVEGYQVERRVAPDGEWQMVARRLFAHRPAFNNFALEPRRTYVYRVRAFNAGGTSAWSGEISATTPAVSARAAPSGRTKPQKSGATASPASTLVQTLPATTNGYLRQSD